VRLTYYSGNQRDGIYKKGAKCSKSLYSVALSRFNEVSTYRDLYDCRAKLKKAQWDCLPCHTAIEKPVIAKSA